MYFSCVFGVYLAPYSQISPPFFSIKPMLDSDLFGDPDHCSPPQQTSDTWGREKGRLSKKINKLSKDLSNSQLQIEKLKSQLGQQERIIDDLYKQLYVEKRKANLQSQRISELEQIITTMRDTQPHPNDRTLGNPTLSVQLIMELRELLTVDPKHRRYSKEMLEICFLIKSLSSKTYRQLRAVFPFPCKETIRLHFMEQIRKNIEETLDINSVHDKLAAYRASIGGSDEIICNLGIDAAAIEIFHLMKIEGSQSLGGLEEVRVNAKFRKVFRDTITADQQGMVLYNNFFAFLLLPLQKQYPILLLHVSPSTDGHMHEYEFEKLHALRDAAAEVGLRICFAATDGETGTNQMHTEQVDRFLGHADVPVEEVTSVIDNNEIWFVSDIFHILKNARSRLINHPIAVNPLDDEQLITAEDIEWRLHLGKALTDCNSESKMNDMFPMQLFRIQNAVSELDSDNYHSGLYILCYALVLQSFCNEDLRTDERLMIIDLTFWLFYQLRLTIDQKLAPGVNQKWRNGAKAVTFADRQTFARILNTLLALRQQVAIYPDGFSTKRLSSHDCENLFGMYRATNGFQSTWDSLQHFIGHLAMQSAIRERRSIKFRPSGRSDYAGAVTSSKKEGVGMRMLENVKLFAAGFVLMCSAAYNPWFHKAYDDMFKGVVNWFRSNISDAGLPSCKTQQSPMKGCAIRSRLIKLGKNE